MNGLKKVTSVSLTQEDWSLLQEMTVRSGWKRCKLMAFALRYLYAGEFKDKTREYRSHYLKFWEENQ